MVKSQLVVSCYKSRWSAYIKWFFPGRSDACVHQVSIATGLASQGHPNAGASTTRVPWGAAFTCPPAAVPGSFAQYQALQSCLWMLKCWSAKFTKGIGKQSKRGKKGIDEWCWWMGRNDAFLLADTAGTAWMEVMDTESNEVIFFFFVWDLIHPRDRKKIRKSL